VPVGIPAPSSVTVAGRREASRFLLNESYLLESGPPMQSGPRWVPSACRAKPLRRAPPSCCLRPAVTLYVIDANGAMSIARGNVAVSG
jgi:hypothetical protein